MSFLSLKIFKEGQLLKTKIFTDDQISIGSSEGLNLQLEGIAPWHVLIEKKHDIFCILDLESEMGTFLNGEKITEETPLSSGSSIQIGPYEIQFFIGPPSEQKAGAETPSQKGKSSSSAKTPSQKKSGKPSVKAGRKKSSSSPLKKTSGKPVPSVSAGEEKSSLKTPLSDIYESSDIPKSSDIPESSEIPKSRPKKPSKKGFWNTYAPSSKIQNLDDFIEPSIGNLIEVIVCWKERILSTHHFSKRELVYIGHSPKCQLKIPNMLGQPSYKLLSVSESAKVHLQQGVQGVLFKGRDKTTRTSHELKGDQNLVLKPYEMIRLNFGSLLRVYVRLMGKPSPPPFAGLLNLRLSEVMALFLAFLLTGLLLFYGSLYAPAFLSEENFIEKDLRVATVLFEKKPEPKQTVEYQLTDRMKRAEEKKKTPTAQRKKNRPIKVAKKAPKIKRPIRNPRKGRQGKAAAQAPGKKPKKTKVSVGSVRPGGSLKTGKKASSAKTQAPDPTKVGLLGAFGGGGKLSQLDKGSSGSGGLLGLAEESTGFAGTEESYEGEGIGTKTKDLGSGGAGSAVVGISGIKTQGKGLGQAGTGAGGLGKRGRMNIEFGTQDIDVTGEIDRGAILQALRRNQSKFQRCYQTGLNEKPSLQGNLSMTWLISSAGRGQSAQAINDLGSSTLANCVANVLESINFPEPPSGQTPKITFTFRFYL